MVDDLISRQAAIDALSGMIDRFERILAVRKEDIDAMHTAESQRIRGRWIPYSIVYENRNYCSECGYHLVGTSKYEANFCPNCGCGYVIETGEEMREVSKE